MRQLTLALSLTLTLQIASTVRADIVTPVSVTGNAASDNPLFQTVFGPTAGIWDNLLNGNTITDLASNRKGFLDSEGNQLPDADFTEANVLSGNVLHDAIFTSESPVGAFHWVTDPRNGEPADFFAAPNQNDPAILTFDLGGTFTLDGMFVWRYTGGPTFGNLQGNNPKGWSLELSNDGGANYSSPIMLDDLALIEDDVSTEDVVEGAGGLPADIYSFSATDANFARLTMPDNFSGSGLNVLGGDRVGLAELHFKSASPGLPGDFNSDDVVDAADYTTWRWPSPLKLIQSS